MTDVYAQAVEIVSDYLGPAADRFLRRQIEFHLDKTPEDLTVADIARMSEWVSTSLSLLTDDKTSVHDCSSRLLKIAHQPIS